jgi:toxin ParE1/3/4
VRRIEQRPKARFDLLALYNYIADDSGEGRAERYLRRLNDAIGYLASQPLMGRARPELGEDIRSFPCDEHVLFYRPMQEGIELVRVIHAKLDLSAAWDEPST